MKKLSFLFLLFIMFSCNTENSTKETTTSSDSTDGIEEKADFSKIGFDVDVKENIELDYEKLRIYPIIASESHIAEHESLAKFKNLKEGMKIQGFRIMEKKPYGRNNDPEAVNSLTVQNKSTETIYMMAGDVLQGGNQDRVLAQDIVVPPRTLTDVSVFCVEPNRWHYQGEVAEENEDAVAKNNRKIFAFTGYYNVVSNDIRKTVKEEKNQQKVWNAVNEMTALNNASTSSGTYAGLERSKDFTEARDKYINYFTGKFDETNDVIGMVAVSGDKVLGTDIFNHPTLFKKQYKVLLHSYVTDAITNGATVDFSKHHLKTYVKNLKENYSKDLGKKEKDTKFRYQGKIVHFSNL